jgi:hypothetical protein
MGDLGRVGSGPPTFRGSGRRPLQSTALLPVAVGEEKTFLEEMEASRATRGPSHPTNQRGAILAVPFLLFSFSDLVSVHYPYLWFW